MTGQDQDDHEIIEIDDLADLLRPAAVDAWNVPESEMAVAETISDLPIAAALQGPQAARRLFKPSVDIYHVAEANDLPLKFTTMERAGIDLVRLSADATFGQIVVVDAANFTVFSVPAGASLANEILNIERQPVFQDPGGNGWSTSAPGLRVEKMGDWHDRIDIWDDGAERLYLLYKTFPSSRMFMPSLEWF